MIFWGQYQASGTGRGERKGAGQKIKKYRTQRTILPGPSRVSTRSDCFAILVHEFWGSISGVWNRKREREGGGAGNKENKAALDIKNDPVRSFESIDKVELVCDLSPRLVVSVGHLGPEEGEARGQDPKNDPTRSFDSIDMVGLVSDLSPQFFYFVFGHHKASRTGRGRGGGTEHEIKKR